MTVSLAEATAAARRIQAGGYPPAKIDAQVDAWRQADAITLAAFVLAGDTERLRTALEQIASPTRLATEDDDLAAPALAAELSARQLIARAALAGGSP